jgi:hypothetical protein
MDFPIDPGLHPAIAGSKAVIDTADRPTAAALPRLRVMTVSIGPRLACCTASLPSAVASVMLLTAAFSAQPARISMMMASRIPTQRCPKSGRDDEPNDFDLPDFEGPVHSGAAEDGATSDAALQAKDLAIRDSGLPQRPGRLQPNSTGVRWSRTANCVSRRAFSSARDHSLPNEHRRVAMSLLANVLCQRAVRQDRSALLQRKHHRILVCRLGRRALPFC